MVARLLALLVGLRVLDSEGCRSALAVQCRALLDQRPLLGPELLKLFRGRWYPQLANLALRRFELLNNNCIRYMDVAQDIIDGDHLDTVMATFDLLHRLKPMPDT